MAARYVAAVRAVQAAGPYHLGGWSLGGVVAFEMARQMREQGQTVATLALIDSFAPSSRPGASRPDDAWIRSAFAADLVRSSGGADLEAELGTGRMQRLLRVFRANALAMADFAPRPQPGHLILYRAADNDAADATLGWGALAEAVAVHAIPGDHYTLLHPPSVDALAGLLDAEIGCG
jgi:thioesterase domain-containing protein